MEASLGACVTDAIGAVNSRAIAKTGKTAAYAKATSEAIQRCLQKQAPATRAGLLDYYLYGLPAAM